MKFTYFHTPVCSMAFKLLALPVELRETIYQFVFSGVTAPVSSCKDQENSIICKHTAVGKRHTPFWLDSANPCKGHKPSKGSLTTLLLQRIKLRQHKCRKLHSRWCACSSCQSTRFSLCSHGCWKTLRWLRYEARDVRGCIALLLTSRKV